MKHRPRTPLENHTLYRLKFRSPCKIQLHNELHKYIDNNYNPQFRYLGSGDSIFENLDEYIDIYDEYIDFEDNYLIYL